MFSLFLSNFLCHLVMCPVAIKNTASIGAVCKFITELLELFHVQSFSPW